MVEAANNAHVTIEDTRLLLREGNFKTRSFPHDSTLSSIFSAVPLPSPC